MAERQQEKAAEEKAPAGKAAEEKPASLTVTLEAEKAAKDAPAEAMPAEAAPEPVVGITSVDYAGVNAQTKIAQLVIRGTVNGEPKQVVVDGPEPGDSRARSDWLRQHLRDDPA